MLEFSNSPILQIKELEESHEVFDVSYEVVHKPKKANFHNVKYSSIQNNIVELNQKVEDQIQEEEKHNEYSFWTYKKNFEKKNLKNMEEGIYYNY